MVEPTRILTLFMLQVVQQIWEKTLLLQLHRTFPTSCDCKPQDILDTGHSRASIQYVASNLLISTSSWNNRNAGICSSHRSSLSSAAALGFSTQRSIPAAPVVSSCAGLHSSCCSPWSLCASPARALFSSLTPTMPTLVDFCFFATMVAPASIYLTLSPLPVQPRVRASVFVRFRDTVSSQFKPFLWLPSWLPELYATVMC